MQNKIINLIGKQLIITSVLRLVVTNMAIAKIAINNANYIVIVSYYKIAKLNKLLNVKNEANKPHYEHNKG